MLAYNVMQHQSLGVEGMRFLSCTANQIWSRVSNCSQKTILQVDTRTVRFDEKNPKTPTRFLTIPRNDSDTIPSN